MIGERVSWVTCPQCGDRAAVGWQALTGAAGETLGELAVEFDCPNGCRAPQQGDGIGSPPE